MPPMVLALGELEHIYDKKNLKLRTNGSISFLSSQAHDLPLIEDPQHLEALVSSGTWVAGGNRLQICFRIFFDDIVVSGSHASDTTEHLGIALSNLEVWSQLSLEASLSLPGTDEDRSGSPSDIVLSLNSQPSSDANVKPPKGIRTAHLEAINLTLSFSTCRRSRVYPKAQQQKIKSEDVDNIQGGEADLTCNDIGEPSGLRSPAQGIIVATNGPRSSHDNGTHHRYATHEVDFGDTLKMVNASLHTMLFGRMPGSRGKSGGVVVSSDEGLPKLVTLSPALFNPGYAQAILHRDAFHSTIAYTMTSIHHRTKSTTLRRRLDRLLDLAPDEYLEEDRIPSPSSGLSSLNLTDAIKARLWLVTKSKMLDPLAGQKLKPLDTLRRTSKEGITSNSMLEDALTGDGSDKPFFDAQHGDPSIDNQHIFIGGHLGYSGYLFEELDVLEADKSHDLLEEYPAFDEDNLTLFDGLDDELLFESQGILTEEDIGKVCIMDTQYPDNDLLRDEKCLASQYPPKNYLLSSGDKEPRFHDPIEDLLLQSQHELMDKGLLDWGSALISSDVLETGDLEDDMLMDGETLTEGNIADGDLL
ncbi:hypothetical protein N7G274_006114 [Stereocaulon virgatum]|uniref:Uncharacterized protein n=1 Tax=Stereocaulon virgatum TaxID=373712 RepID=A0ABR4A6S1_9LECA